MPSPEVEPPTDVEPPPLEFRLLGGCEIRVQGTPLPPPRYHKERWLLALLVLRHDRETSRDTLAAAFWPDSDPDRALFYLRRSLTHLRAALGPEAGRLRSPSPRTLQLDLSGAFADVLAFDRAVRKTPSHSSSEEALAQAVALYLGPLLPDCAEEWVLPERAERAQAHLSALEGLAQAAMEWGDPHAAVPWLRRIVAADPLRESASGSLMQALAAGGDRAAADQVYHDLRRSLHEHRNADVSPETRALHQQLQQQAARPASTPSNPPAPPLLRRLPIPLTDLIGRAREAEEVAGWLGRRRLVTLVGDGGVGKTRLAIAAADALLPQFAEGVWFVDLAALSDPVRVPEAAAKALGIEEEAGQAAEQRLAEALAASSLLLVLDNCEHVLDACASFAASLLSACPHLRVLATSRQSLGMPGEQVYAVPALALPPEERYGPKADPAHAEKNVLALLDYEAVRLFVERATQTSPSFRLTRSNAESVVDICRRLDGIPLALELAAARVRSLSPPEICARLEDRFRLLRIGSRAAAPRHQTLQAAMDWSDGLLTAPERSLLHGLSVFAGGWRLDAAEAVCLEAVGEEPGGLLDLLTGLVDKSLVVAALGDAGTRYGLLETVRQYARKRLRESGQEEDAARRQAAWALALAEEAGSHLSGADAALHLDRLESEHDNLRAALDWYTHQPPEWAGEHLRLAGALASFWAARGHYRTGRQRLQAALAHSDRLPLVAADRPARARAVRGAAILASSQGDYPVARLLFEEALTLRRALGDPVGIADAISNVGTVTWLQGDLASAQALYGESLSLYRALGNARGVAQALYNSGILACDLASDRDGFDAVRPLLEEAAARFDALEDTRGKSYALNALGNVLIEQQDFQAAQAVHEENLGIALGLNDPLLIADAQAMLSVALSGQGDYRAASSLLAEALARRLEMGDRRNAAIALSAAAAILAGQGREMPAARLWGAAEALRDQIGFPLTPRQQAAHDQEVAQTRDGADGPRFAAAWAAGQALTLEEMIKYALSDMTV